MSEDRHALSEPRLVPSSELDTALASIADYSTGSKSSARNKRESDNDGDNGNNGGGGCGGPAWYVDVYRKGVPEPIETLVINDETLPPRKNKKGKVIWRLPDLESAEGGRMPNFGSDERRRILELFKERKKMRKKSVRKSSVASASASASVSPEAKPAATATATATATAATATTATTAPPPSTSSSASNGDSSQSWSRGRVKAEAAVDSESVSYSNDNKEKISGSSDGAGPAAGKEQAGRGGAGGVSATGGVGSGSGGGGSKGRRKKKDKVPRRGGGGGGSEPEVSDNASIGASVSNGMGGEKASGDVHAGPAQQQQQLPPPGFKPPSDSSGAAASSRGAASSAAAAAAAAAPQAVDDAADKTARLGLRDDSMGQKEGQAGKPAPPAPSSPCRYITIPPSDRPAAFSSMAVPAAKSFVDLYYPHVTHGLSAVLAEHYTSTAQKSVSVGGAHSVVTGRHNIEMQLQSLAGARFVVRGVVSQDGPPPPPTSIAGAAAAGVANGDGSLSGLGAHILVTGLVQTAPTAPGLAGSVTPFAHSISLVPAMATMGEEEARYAFQIHNDALSLLTVGDMAGGPGAVGGSVQQQPAVAQPQPPQAQHQPSHHPRPHQSQPAPSAAAAARQPAAAAAAAVPKPPGFTG